MMHLMMIMIVMVMMLMMITLSVHQNLYSAIRMGGGTPGCQRSGKILPHTTSVCSVRICQEETQSNLMVASLLDGLLDSTIPTTKFTYVQNLLV